MTEIATLYVTTSGPEESRTLARTLLEEKQIACANIFPSVTSLYRWNGEIRSDEESVLLLKIPASRIDSVTSRVRELHSYECPCIVAWRSTEGNEAYLQWVLEEAP